MEQATLEYIERGRHTVPGWFDRLDAFLFAAVDDAHRAAGVTGDLMEIGTYLGRCAVLLGYLQRPGERLVVCDLFDGHPVNEENEAERDRFYTDLTRQAFEANFRRFHSRLPDEVVSGPSSQLHERATELEHSFRIIHIDGSHEYDAVQSDIRLSRQLLAEGGVVHPEIVQGGDRGVGTVAGGSQGLDDLGGRGVGGNRHGAPLGREFGVFEPFVLSVPFRHGDRFDAGADDVDGAGVGRGVDADRPIISLLLAQELRGEVGRIGV